MGWCSATVIFDSVCDALLAEGDKKPTPEETIRAPLDVTRNSAIVHSSTTQRSKQHGLRSKPRALPG